MNTEERILKTLARMNVQVDGVTARTTLKDDLEIDSAEQVELVVSLGEEFTLSLGPEAEKVATFGELCAYIENELNQSTGDSGASPSE